MAGESRDPDGPEYGPKVPAGYRRTDVGVIPEDWKVDRIDQHTCIKTGSKNTEDKEEGGQYPFFVRSPDVERIGTYSYDGEAVLTAGDGSRNRENFSLRSWPVRRASTSLSHFRLFRSAERTVFFFQFSERFYHRIMSMTAKSSVDSVRMEMIAGMLIPLPPRREQRAIAAVLSDVDELIGSLEALIAKKRAVKRAAMQQLLTGRIRLPGFSGEWETKRLGEVWGIPQRQGHQANRIAGDRIPLRTVRRALHPVSELCGQPGIPDSEGRSGNGVADREGRTAACRVGRDGRGNRHLCCVHRRRARLCRWRHHRPEGHWTGSGSSRAPTERPGRSPPEGAYGSGRCSRSYSQRSLGRSRVPPTPPP